MCAPTSHSFLSRYFLSFLIHDTRFQCIIAMHHILPSGHDAALYYQVIVVGLARPTPIEELSFSFFLKFTFKVLFLAILVRLLSLALKWFCPGTRATILPLRLTRKRLLNDLFVFIDLDVFLRAFFRKF